MQYNRVKPCISSPSKLSQICVCMLSHSALNYSKHFQITGYKERFDIANCIVYRINP